MLDSNYPNYEENKIAVKEQFEVKLKDHLDRGLDLVFVGYILPGLVLENQEIANDIFFNYSVFTENVKIKNTNFQKKCVFTYAKFVMGCSFNKCTFYDCKFENVIFMTKNRVSSTNGIETVWKGPRVSFSSSKFNDNANFRSIKTFSVDVFFNTCEFNKKVDFGYSNFTNIDFEKAIFLSEVNFFNSQITNGKFNDTTFRGQLHMNSINATDLSFGQSQFGGLFLNMNTIGHCSFWNSEFSDKIELEKTSFKYIDFRQCIFRKRSYFKTVQFQESDFTFAEFDDAVYFLNCSYEGKMRFNFVKFEKPEQIYFQEADLTYVSFLNTDITRINFGDKVRFGGKDGNTIFEETALIQSIKNNETQESSMNMRNVLSVYRNLRENYEYRLRYDEAGSFFVKEMELKRKYKETVQDDSVKIVKKNWISRNVFSLLRIYKTVANYGESYRRPIVVGLLVSSCSMLIWLTQSNPFLEPNFDSQLDQLSLISKSSNFIGFDQIQNVTQWISATERTTIDFFLFIPGNENIKIGLIDTIIKLLSSSLVLIPLGIALRRKLERRFRH
jgi:uncharacterized protein YjbI with pentapeptide repeats